MTDLELFWPDPAEHWNQALPLGNGRLGAMVFGGIGTARIQLNDATVWSGTPGGPAAALADVLAAGAGPARLAEVRTALLAGDHRLAEKLLMTFEGPYSQEFLPFGDLLLTLDGAGDYHGRYLNLDNGIIREKSTVDNRKVLRETWVSRPSGTVTVSLTVTGGALDAGLALSSPLRTVLSTADPGGLVLGVEIPVDGAPLHEPEVAEPLRYADGPVDGYDPFGVLALRLNTDGAVSAVDGRLVVTGLTRLLITLATSTSAADHWTGAPGRTRQSHIATATGIAARAARRDPAELRAEHEADLRPLLAATTLRIGEQRGGVVDVAREVLSGNNEQLTATVLFQWGRYLLAAASRPGGGPPANLQGIWNTDLRPAWSSNYTININTQMNYWPAESTGLSECHDPLFDLLDRLAVTGTEVARELYGARGWVTHHNTDPWGYALPAGMGHGNPSWALWMLGGAWLVQHAWDRYEYTVDGDFLRERGWPLLRGCAEFCLDWLVESTDGRLDTLPGTSPENLFHAAGGSPESLTHSPTMDVALIRAVLTRCLAAAEVLGLRQDPVCLEIDSVLPRLRPLPITAGGWLGEWAQDLPEVDPQHRHMSQMVAVFPLNQINPDDTPELAEAARNLLDRRGNGAMGWSWAWKIALRARLGDGETARELFLEASRPFTGDPHRNAPVDGSEWGGLLPNLFSTHPPFQIDGNYGFTAALAELVVQSHGSAVHLLPALPQAWPDGAVTGLRCRGGLAVDLTWQDGQLTQCVVRRLSGDPDRPIRVRHRDRTTEVRLDVGASARLDSLTVR
ncbi:glycosyl hydrolase family 95 catalytic domain-containing protein [Crossiella cryophila]|uniref:Alpha-L-fucosidase 2 n=1 Tax=Crossiella cryophila TaxID=43355 RepID=A0A7W7FYX9_9PSEU|nr:glycoside hydrolase N-terminal domain-containing protein [Crossiella cryophila]MBB4680559.1 alpha-L-fucosidase 2 [Crossiella cryophila]